MRDANGKRARTAPGATGGRDGHGQPGPGEPPARRAAKGLCGRISPAVMNRLAVAVDPRVHIAAANLWRDQFNPLRGLTIQRAVTLLEEGERGAYADLQWTYRFIEQQDATLGALVDRRLSAVGEMDWDIRTSSAAGTPEEEAMAARQAGALKDLYDGVANLRAAIDELCLASFRGFAHLEMVRGADGDLVELAAVPQWHWVRKGINGRWQYNRAALAGTTAGEDVPLERFVIREVARPINRVALVAFIRKSLSAKDWDAFVETFGVPAIFLVMPEAFGEEEAEAFQDTAEAIIGDARGVLPGGSEVKTVDNGARGVNPFREHLRNQDEQMVLRGTGGMLTMLTEAGSGTLAGGAHSETFAAIARAEARAISELLRARIDRPFLEEKFPGEPQLAYFAIASNEETDTSTVVADVVSLSGAGMPVDPAWVEEKTGYKLKAQGASTQEEAAGGIRNRERGGRMPEELRASLRRWADSLPGMDPDPALEDEAAAALADGIAGQEEERKGGMGSRDERHRHSPERPNVRNEAHPAIPSYQIPPGNQQ